MTQLDRRVFAASLILILTVLAFAFASSAQAATMFACSGAPAGYVTQFDTVRGQLKDGNVRYPERRVWLGWQSWLTPTVDVNNDNVNDIRPGHDSEHMHIEACVPQGETWVSPNDDRYLDVAFTFHNMIDYEITKIGGSFVTQTGSSGAFTTTQAQLDELTAAANTSGHLGAEVVYQSHKVRPSTTNGVKEMRWGLTATNAGPDALVEEWVLDARWYVTDAYAGLPAATPLVEHVRYIRLRTIAEFFNTSGVLATDYHHSGFAGSWQWTRDTIAVPWSGVHDVELRVTDGGGPAAVEIDPNHHVHPDSRGRWFTDFFMFSGSGVEAFHTVQVPTAGFPTTGFRKFVFLSTDFPECMRNANVCPANARAGWTNVSVLPFRAAP